MNGTKKTSPTIRQGLSESQRAAVTDFGQSVALVAGAGSGKTTVLVERFLHAVTALGASAERILAITFTEKAADELKSRLVNLCHERGLGDLRRPMENAWIGTIDGFCARILKENPIEAGVDPFFGILGEGEAEILINRVTDEIFQEESSNDSWLSVLTDLGENEVRVFLKHSATLSRSSEKGRLFFEVMEFVKEERDAAARLESLLKSVRVQIPAEPSNETEADMLEGSQELLALLRNGAPRDWQTDGLIRLALKRFKKRGRLKILAGDVTDLGDEWLSCRLQAMSSRSKMEINAVMHRFLDRYEREKKKLAVYDFSDLLFAAHKLFSGTSEGSRAIQNHYREYFQHIFVDEYQDTNGLQARLFDCIQNGNNLFVVGDLKQSIYGFRGAEPRIFAQLLRSNRRLELQDNYRSRPELISLVNGLFEKIFPAELYSPMTERKEYPPAQPGLIEVLCVPKDGEAAENQDQSRIREAAMIALKINRWITSQALVEEGGLMRPMRYGDVAILFRSMTCSHFYEKALTDQGIPYRLVKGKGFYDKPEVKDLIHLLKIIENPTLDISLACVLRSPLFSLSDEGLYWLAQDAKHSDNDAPLFKGVARVGSNERLSVRDREKLDEFCRFFENAQLQKDRCSVAQILEETLGARNLEAKLLMRGVEGRQKVANVRKLVETARQLGEGVALGLADFIRYVENLADRETIEAEAKIEPEKSNVVTLSSIHAAKGLEFPCVVIADMGKNRSGRRHGLISASETFGIGLRLKNPLTFERVDDRAYTLTKQEVERADREEEDRLFYVAMTRARERLVFSGSVSWNTKENCLRLDGSWMSRLLQILGVESLDGKDIPWESFKIPITSSGPATEVVRSEMVTPVNEWAFQKIRRGESLSKEDEAKLGFSLDSGAAQEICRRFVPPKKPYSFLRDVSVTELLAEEGRAREPYRPQLGFSDEENIPRNEFGTLFHRAMELSVQRMRVNQALSRDYLNPLLQGLSDNEKDEIIDGVLGFWKSGWGQAVRKASRCYPELPFVYKTPSGLLKGQMDLVYCDEAGRWVVLDYKTNRLTPGEKDAASEEYRFQLALYALVFRDLFGQAPEMGVLYFSTLGQTVEFLYGPAEYEAVQRKLLIEFDGLNRIECSNT